MRSRLLRHPPRGVARAATFYARDVRSPERRSREGPRSSFPIHGAAWLELLFFCIVFVPRFLGISGRAWACGRRVIPMIVYPLSNERATGDSKESQGKSGFPLPHTRSRPRASGTGRNMQTGRPEKSRHGAPRRQVYGARAWRVSRFRCMNSGSLGPTE